MGSTWFTSDLHLGHTNIITYCNRPFSNVDEMNEALIEAWNSVVYPSDQVFILGDLALGHVEDSLPLVSFLAGHKILVPGNHDRCWENPARNSSTRNSATGTSSAKTSSSLRRPPSEWALTYLEHVQEIRPSGTFSHPALDRPVVLSHFPYVGDSGPSDRFLEARPADRGEWLLHGHVHDVWRQRNRQINVGVDAWAGRPVNLDEIASVIEEGPRHLERLPWR
jgi:calcineurin-like phosphoesterase family protein